MTRALVVVDVQNDFCEGGSMGVAGGVATAARIGQLLARRSDSGYAVVAASKDHHIDPGGHFSDQPDFVDSWPPHCVVGTDGADFHPDLQPRPFDTVFRKGEHAAAYSGFEGSAETGEPPAEWLRARGVDEVDVCGIATDYCVRATALDSAAAGFTTRVLLDLTAAVAPGRLASTWAAWADAGVAVTGRVPVPALLDQYVASMDDEGYASRLLDQIGRQRAGWREWTFTVFDLEVCYDLGSATIHDVRDGHVELTVRLVELTRALASPPDRPR